MTQVVRINRVIASNFLNSISLELFCSPNSSLAVGINRHPSGFRLR